MKKPLFIIAALFALTACQVDNPVSMKEERSINGESKVISKDVALGHLDDLLLDIYGDTKADAPKYDANNVTIFGGVVTKSGNVTLPDTTVYIVNFENNSGYAVMAAQTCMEAPVFCITESGSLSVDDLQSALSYLDENSSSFTTSEITYKEGDEEIDVDLFSEDDDEYYFTGINFSTVVIAASISNQMIADTVVSADTYKYVTSKKIGPLLTTKWTQWSPFNDFRSDDAPAGCVAIATAQILACNEKNAAFDWELLKTVYPYNDYRYDGSNEAKAAASDFLQFIGSHNNCRIKYGTKGSSGWAKGAKRTLVNFGYSNVKKYLGFGNKNKGRTTSMLSKELPVYVDGSNNKKGHAWVVDGILVRHKLHIPTMTAVETQNLYHINWGWQGVSDGYYHQGVFNTTDRVLRDAMDRNGDVDNKQYTWNYRVVTYSL